MPSYPPSWLKTVEPYTKLLPQVQKAPQTVSTQLKLFYTFLSLLVYLAGSYIPLFGISATIRKDPVFWLRSIFSSSRGSLMELGLGPTMTSGLIVRMCVSAGLLRYNRNDKDESELFARFNSLVGAVFTVGQAILYVFTGMYGSFSDLGLINAVLVIAYLAGASIIIQMLDHMMEQGWGMGSGASLFTTASTCESIMWKMFSFIKIDRGYGTEIEGAIPAAIHMIINRGSKLEAIKLAFFRQGLPNLIDVMSTLLVLGAVVYLQGIRKQIKIVHEQAGEQMQQSYPIRLLYASSTPMMIISTVTQNIYMISQALWRKYGNSFIIKLLGSWQENEMHPGRPYPIGGLAWILAPPYSFKSAIFHPVHTLLHAAVIVTISGFAARLWVNFSGESAKDVAMNLKNYKWIIPGFKRDQEMIKELDRYIPIAAMTGGVVLGILSLFADISGCLVSGTNLLMAATNLVKMYEDYAKKSMGGF